MAPARKTSGSGQESVWDYPRPPRVEPVQATVRVEFNDATVAETENALRVLETSHPPTYYIPREDVRMEYLQKEASTTVCEWKGRAVYFAVEVGERRATHAAWSYPDPEEDYANLSKHVAFYANKMDACYVGDEQVQP